jgi:ubiquinone/menaquinone biosynthesis C-methylase UbiE
VTDPVAIQREYYRRTAGEYDALHLEGEGEHEFALAILSSMISFLEIRSLIDIGAGTGRALLGLRQHHPGVTLVGIEPSPELRAIGRAKGLSDRQLIDGDGAALDFADNAFDVACAFGVLHHVARPGQVVAEMLRVAAKAVFISDSNSFGQGPAPLRLLKQALHAARLWPLANFIKTRGKGYVLTEGDGLAYSYSVFQDYPSIRRACRSVHIINTTPAGVDPYRSATHVALLGLK